MKKNRDPDDLNDSSDPDSPTFHGYSEKEMKKNYQHHEEGHPPDLSMRKPTYVTRREKRDYRALKSDLKKNGRIS